MTVAYGYVRVSSEAQVQSGLSLDAQSESIQKYIKDKGFENGGIFVDGGISGVKPIGRRPNGSALLNRLKKGDVLAVTRLDRISRNKRDFLSLIDYLNKIGAALHVLDLGGNVINLATPLGEVFALNVVAIGEMEALNAGERMRVAHAQRRKRLGTNKSPHYQQIGYKVVGGKGNKRLVEDPDQMEILARMRTLHEYGLSIRQITARLNRRANGRMLTPYIYGVNRTRVNKHAIHSGDYDWNPSVVHNWITKAYEYNIAPATVERVDPTSEVTGVDEVLG